MGHSNRRSGLGCWQWVVFIIVLLLFVGIVVYAHHEHDLAGRIVDPKGEACVVVSGSSDDYVLSRVRGRSCAGANSVFAMQGDHIATPIYFQSGTGPLMCLTDNRSRMTVSLEPCLHGEANQLWSHNAGDNHIRSDAAVLVGDKRQCLSGAGNVVGAAIGANMLRVVDCSNHNSQEWSFAKLE